MTREEAIELLCGYVLDTEEEDYKNLIEANDIDPTSEIASLHVYKLAEFIIKEGANAVT